MRLRTLKSLFASLQLINLFICYKQLQVGDRLTYMGQSYEKRLNKRMEQKAKADHIEPHRAKMPTYLKNRLKKKSGGEERDITQTTIQERTA